MSHSYAIPSIDNKILKRITPIISTVILMHFSSSTDNSIIMSVQAEQFQQKSDQACSEDSELNLPFILNSNVDLNVTMLAVIPPTIIRPTILAAFVKIFIRPLAYTFLYIF